MSISVRNSLLRRATRENMSKSEFRDFLLRVQRQVADYPYSVYEKDGKYFKGYKDKRHGDSEIELTKTEYAQREEAINLRHKLDDGLVYYDINYGWRVI